MTATALRRAAEDVIDREARGVYMVASLNGYTDRERAALDLVTAYGNRERIKPLADFPPGHRALMLLLAAEIAEDEEQEL